jgi:hypothetical protein
VLVERCLRFVILGILGMSGNFCVLMGIRDKASIYSFLGIS